MSALSAFQQYMQDGTSTDDHMLAVDVTNKWTAWKSAKAGFESEIAEIRNYVFATDTRTTSNAKLPHKNSTTLPKLTSIRDNLYANYSAALFPNSEWLSWEADDERSARKDIRVAIEAVMRTKLRQSGFEDTMLALLLDYIDTGNPMAQVIWVDERGINEDGTRSSDGYVGSKVVRISPYDIVFDSTADDFKSAGKIIRRRTTIHQLIKENATQTSVDLRYDEDVLAQMKERRDTFNSTSSNTLRDRNKISSDIVDGFGDAGDYLGSNIHVEVLEFEGDILDTKTGEMHENVLLTIVDRSLVLRNTKVSSLKSVGSKYHVGWRLRPDSLYAQGPLNNLVGMQYRIDHLENMKADAFDKISNPQKLIKGSVEDFIDVPGENIYLGDDGGVSYLHPDTAVMSADNQIARLEQLMEDYAGAPKEAMGVRTPGEKTAYEVQSLDTRASRVFQNKIKQYERGFVEPIVNAMYQLLLKYQPDEVVVAKVVSAGGVQEFKSFRREDFKGVGKLYPKGARHFEAQAKLVQNLTQFFSSPLGQNKLVSAHFSGKALAKILDEALGLERYTLFSENAAITEAIELTRLEQAATSKLAQEDAAQTDVSPEEIEGV